MVLTSSGYLKSDIYESISTAFTSICSQTSSEEMFEEKSEYICCLLVELTKLNGTKEAPIIAGFLLDLYSDAGLVDGNLWLSRRLDEIVGAIQKSHPNNLVCLICELALILCRRAFDTSQCTPASVARYARILTCGYILPSHIEICRDTNEVVVDANMLLIGRVSSAEVRVIPSGEQARDAALGTLSACLLRNDTSKAYAVIRMMITRCGRTVTEHNRMHTSFFRDLQAPPPYFAPLRFVAPSVPSDSDYPFGRIGRGDIVWGIWRAIHSSTSSSTVSEYVAYLASLYAYRWTAARRHIRLNLILYACAIACRGYVRYDEPHEEFKQLIEVAKVRVLDLYNDSVISGIHVGST